MLNAMRNLTSNWIGRTILSLVMGFIMLSFVVWGIGDVFRGFGSNNLAKVGSSEITTAAFKRNFDQQIQAAQQQARRNITPDEARRAGLDRLALNKMIADNALDQKAQALSLGMSNESVAKIIGQDPGFKGISGTFDKKRFDDAMRNSGYSEPEFVNEERRTYLRREIAVSLAADPKVPDVLLDAYNAYTGEVRSIEYISLPASSVGEIPPPDDATLKAFFEGRKAEFRAPEYRSITMLSLSPSALAKADAISDGDVSAAYERAKDKRFTTVETRKLEQIVFPTETDAKAASDKIKAGTGFAQVADEAKLKPIDLGIKKQSEMIDKAVADASFSLAADAVSEPVKTTLGFALVHVLAITPTSVKSLAEATPVLKEELALERAKAEIQTLHDKIEDQRTSGKSLTDAAKAAGVEVITLDGVDATGLDKSGKPRLAISETAPLLKAVFASDIGVDNETILNRDGGFTWFEVQKIELSRERTLDEVKDRVVNTWTESQTAKKLGEAAADAVKKLNAGTSLNDIAVSLGNQTIKSASNISRGGKSELAPNFVAQVFNQPLNGAASVALADGTRAVFRITESKVAPLDHAAPATKQISEQLKASIADDIIAQYLTKLQTDLGVTINDQVYNQIIGQK